MIYVVLAFAAGWLLACFYYAHGWRGLIREHARERQLLINQILNLSGKPWLPAPAEPTWQPEPEPELDRYLATPEQLPD